MNHQSNNRHRRGNDEFLRRMLGGELTGAMPVMNSAPSTPMPSPKPPVSAPGCNGQQVPSCPIGNRMPSLAMVYSPVQTFEGLYSPTEGLEQGSLFRDLVKPFEGKWQREVSK